MVSIESLLLPRFVSLIVSRFRSIGLLLFNFLMNIYVHHLTTLSRVTKHFGGHVQDIVANITGNHYSLVNVADDDFSIGTTAQELFTHKHGNQHYDNPNMHDVFHIYLSKILYELPNRITDRCNDWGLGFDKDSIEVLHSQSEDITKYPYSTQAAVIYHDESKTIIVAFRGTEPMDLLQWMTDASTDFTVIDYAFKNEKTDDQIQVHAGFYHALGLGSFNPSKPIDFSSVNDKSPMISQVLKAIQKCQGKDNKCKISITGHSLGAGLASLFSFALLASDDYKSSISGVYESSISAVYTYGQPLVGNRRYAEILNKRLGNRLHRWVNHSDIVTRIPLVQFPSISWYYTQYAESLEAAVNEKKQKSNPPSDDYYHSGLRFKIDQNGNLERQTAIDEEPMRAFEDRLDLFHFIYFIKKAIYSLREITPLRSLLWLTAPVEINDHFPGDYARTIKKIVTKK